MKSSCTHPALFKTMCVSCGKIIKPETGTGFKVTTMHGGSSLQVTELESKSIEANKIANLREKKKIALVLDLDHTLLHAVQIDGPIPAPGTESAKDRADGIFHLPIDETVNGQVKHLIMKKRPFLDDFLKAANEFCQMTIYTAGTRRYAEAVVDVIDKENIYFSKRIVSRTDSKSDGHDKSLERIFLGDPSMAVIIDDREDVWAGRSVCGDSNDVHQLLLARPFIYFNAHNMNNNVIVEANHASGPMHAATPGGSTNGKGSAGGAPSGASPMTPVISLSSECPGRILKTVPQTSNEFSGSDDQLKRCLDIVREIHRRYYDVPSSTAAPGASDGNSNISGSTGLKNIEDKIGGRSPKNINNSNNSGSSNSNGSVDGTISSSSSVTSGNSGNSGNSSNGGKSSTRPKHVARILAEMKRSVLAGCTITFSGIIPTNETRPQDHLLYKLAVSLGATVSMELLPRTTHLISVNCNTSKALECVKTRSHDVWILHPDWLIYCRWALARALEVTFMLNVIQPGTPFPAPVMNSLPLTPTISKRPKSILKPPMQTLDNNSNNSSSANSSAVGVVGAGEKKTVASTNDNKRNHSAVSGETPPFLRESNGTTLRESNGNTAISGRPVPVAGDPRKKRMRVEGGNGNSSAAGNGSGEDSEVSSIYSSAASASTASSAGTAASATARGQSKGHEMSAGESTVTDDMAAMVTEVLPPMVDTDEDESVDAHGPGRRYDAKGDDDGDYDNTFIIDDEGAAAGQEEQHVNLEEYDVDEDEMAQEAYSFDNCCDEPRRFSCGNDGNDDEEEDGAAEDVEQEESIFDREVTPPNPYLPNVKNSAPPLHYPQHDSRSSLYDSGHSNRSSEDDDDEDFSDFESIVLNRDALNTDYPHLLPDQAEEDNDAAEYF